MLFETLEFIFSYSTIKDKKTKISYKPVHLVILHIKLVCVNFYQSYFHFRVSYSYKLKADCNWSRLSFAWKKRL